MNVGRRSAFSGNQGSNHPHQNNTNRQQQPQQKQKQQNHVDKKE